MQSQLGPNRVVLCHHTPHTSRERETERDRERGEGRGSGRDTETQVTKNDRKKEVMNK